MTPLDFDRQLAKYFPILYKLAEMGARHKDIRASTKLLAEKIGVSQQSISRNLIEMERLGWIQRVNTHEGNLIKISSLGETQLRNIHTSLNIVFGEKHPAYITIDGTVFSGLGEGAYYVTRPVYRKQFVEKLGFDPFPGTLNVKVTSEYDNKLKNELGDYPGIEIEGFKNKDRTYGSVKCFAAMINNKEKATVVYALRSHYPYSVMEIISPANLRKRLKLRDGNKVRIQIFLS